MYCINVMSDGKYHNVVIGKRYAFTKHSAKKTISTFQAMECVIIVTKFIKCGGVWMWSTDNKLY